MVKLFKIPETMARVNEERCKKQHNYIHVLVTGEKNSPTVAHACRRRRLKWVLPRLGVGAQG
jgi:hypothetical protein